MRGTESDARSSNYCENCSIVIIKYEFTYQVDEHQWRRNKHTSIHSHSSMTNARCLETIEDAD